MGSAFSFSEFISADALVHGNEVSRQMLRFCVEERPVVIQIFGKDPDILADAAQIVEEAGADMVDLNMGCSASRVAGGGAGAALLKNLNLASKIVVKMVKRVKIPVSAKIRLGWDNNSRNYTETVRMLEQSGIAMISVHGRTKAQAYGGSADWDAIGEIKEQSSVPIIGNGDVQNFAEAERRMERYGVDGVLIGRAAIGNPWIFSDREGSPPSLNEMVDLMLFHLSEMEAFYGRSHSLILFRKHAARYIRGFYGAKECRIRLLTTESRDEFIDICESLRERWKNDIAV